MCQDLLLIFFSFFFLKMIITSSTMTMLAAISSIRKRNTIPTIRPVSLRFGPVTEGIVAIDDLPPLSDWDASDVMIITDGSLVVRTRDGETVVRITMPLVGDAVIGETDVLRSTSFVLNVKVVVGILVNESVGAAVWVGVMLWIWVVAEIDTVPVTVNVCQYIYSMYAMPCRVSQVYYYQEGHECTYKINVLHCRGHHN